MPKQSMIWLYIMFVRLTKLADDIRKYAGAIVVVYSVLSTSSLAASPEVLWELSNEAYLQTGFDKQEFPSWTLIDLELYAESKFDLSEQWQALAGIKVGAGVDALETEAEIEEYYVGFDFNGYQFGYGAKEYATEDYDLDLEMDFGRKTDFEQIGDRGKEVLFFQTERENYELGLSVNLESQRRSYDIFAKFDVGDSVELLVAYQKNITGQHTVNTSGVMLVSKIGEWDLIAGVSSNERQQSADIGLEREFNNGSKLAVSCGVERFRASSLKDRQRICFANYAHRLSDYFFINTEIGYLDTEEAHGFGFLIGVEFEYE